jgi:hypothetical protein
MTLNSASAALQAILGTVWTTTNSIPPLVATADISDRRLPHFRTDGGAQLLFRHGRSQSFGLRLFRYGDRDMIRELPQLDE